MRILKSAIVALAGWLLSDLLVYIIGWLSAIAVSKETFKAMKSVPVFGFMFLNFGHNLVPALALSAVLGYLIRSTIELERAKIVIFGSVPWVLTLIFDQPPTIWFKPANWVLWPVLLAVPAGLYLGTRSTQGPNSVTCQHSQDEHGLA